MPLGFGQVADILMLANALHPSKRETLVSRLKQWQKMGFPAGVNVGRGVRAEYGATELFQLAFHMRLLTMGLTPERSQQIITNGWDRFRGALVLAAAGKAAQEPTMTYLVIQYDALTDLKEPGKHPHSHIFVRATPHWMIAEALNDYGGQLESDEGETEQDREFRERVMMLVRNDLVNAIILETDSIMLRVWGAMVKLGIDAEVLRGSMKQWAKEEAKADENTPPTIPVLDDNLAGVELCPGCFAETLFDMEKGHEHGGDS